MKTIYSPNADKLCKWLIQQRKIKDLTMREVAEIIDKPHSFIGKIEAGQRRLDVVEFVWYCQKLDLDPIAGIKHLLT